MVAVGRVLLGGAVAFAVFALIFLYFGLSLALTLTPQPLSSLPKTPPQQWFMTFRAIDVAFLALTVFAATLGVAALFRYEGEKPGPEEEVLVEGEVEEVEEEEEV
ncbi:MAG: hypothetical protein DRJ97_07380 [Thermoprotei archaeon]|nr:MAG: hypothetical protein DRJ69_00930 [Thermoprotei archaeon]RLF13809.1 MAG: hypothetical protein DRJ97_07380 [Thermoprotei archaeon]